MDYGAKILSVDEKSLETLHPMQKPYLPHEMKNKSDLEIGDMEIMMEDLLYYHYVDSCLSSDYPVWAELFPFQVEPSLHLSRISVIRFFFSLFTVKSTFQYLLRAI